MRSAMLFASVSLVTLLTLGGARAAKAEVAAADATEVEGIVVTGEKAARSLQETTTSVAVTTAEKIERENVVNFFDIVQRTANVSETYGPSGFTIRGISNTNVSGGGAGGLATVYVDGAAIPERGLNGGPLDMWDIGQVEILRGPQSTLQGRNALAGAVVIRSAEPSFTFGGRVRGLVSDADDRSLAAVLTGPIVEDQLAFRLAAETRRADGFVYNVTRKEDAGAVDATTIRGKLLFTPSALPDLTVRTVWLHDKREGGYVFTYSRTDVPDIYDDRISEGDAPNLSDTTTDILTVEADYDLSDRLNLSSVTSWIRVDNVSKYDADDTAQPLAFGIQDEVSKTLSQELRLNYQGERLSGLVGFWYSKRDRDYELTSLATVETPKPTLIALMTSPLFGLNLPTATFAADTYAAALPAILVDFHSVTPEEIETVALFADGRYQLTDKLSLLAGFRYDREQNTLTNDQTATFAGTLPNPAAFGPLAPVIGGLNQVVLGFVGQANASAPTTTRDFEAFLPKLGVKYDFNDDISASFVVQRGYRSGGSTVNIARSNVVAYDPEFTWNYEASLRSEWLDGTLLVNANAYYVDWSDQQVTVNLGLNLYDYQTENAGSSHLYGFEIEINHAPTNQFSWYASLGHTKTEFEDFDVELGALSLDLSGTEFAFAPHWTFAAGADWRWGNGFVANLNAGYRSDAYSEVGAQQADAKIKARTLVNGKIGYETDRWGVFAYGKNLLNEEYVQYNQPSLSRAMLGDPRVLGVILETRW